MLPPYNSAATVILVAVFPGKVTMIDTILDACKHVLEINGDPQSRYWLASQMMEMRLWRASEHDVLAALENDISEFREHPQFVKVADDEWAMRSWTRSS